MSFNGTPEVVAARCRERLAQVNWRSAVGADSGWRVGKETLDVDRDFLSIHKAGWRDLWALDGKDGKGLEVQAWMAVDCGRFVVGRAVGELATNRAIGVGNRSSFCFALDTGGSWTTGANCAVLTYINALASLHLTKEHRNYQEQDLQRPQGMSIQSFFNSFSLGSFAPG